MHLKPQVPYVVYLEPCIADRRAYVVKIDGDKVTVWMVPNVTGKEWYSE